MTTMTATTTVLHREADGRFTHRSGREQQRFLSRDDDGRQHMLFLDAEVDDDLGNPEQVTVTVEPGDRLNLTDGCVAEHSPASNPGCIMQPAEALDA